MKLDPSIIALKDFENMNVIRLKLARYSTANKAPSINASERLTKQIWIAIASSPYVTQLFRKPSVRSQHK
jgi:hypothetical protein